MNEDTTEEIGEEVGLFVGSGKCAQENPVGVLL